jgi:hypothetical protein
MMVFVLVTSGVEFVIYGTIAPLNNVVPFDFAGRSCDESVEFPFYHKFSLVISAWDLSLIVLGPLLVVRLYMKHLGALKDRLKLKQELKFLLAFWVFNVVQKSLVVTSTDDDSPIRTVS